MTEDINNKQLQKRIDLLKKLVIFSETSEETLEDVALALTELNIETDEALFCKGDYGADMYIIIKGSVKIHDGDHVFTVLREGKAFGEYSILEASHRTASVTALENCLLLKLDQKTFYDILSSKEEITQGVLKSLVNRVIDKDELEAELVKRNYEIMQQKEEIETQRDEIEAQRDQIANQKKEITDSIIYAKRIQNALLKPDDSATLHKYEHFVLYKPKDIVSGDFYWVKEYKNMVLVAVADCTGHGVPGAFMSLLGITFLNEIFTYYQLMNKPFVANDILNELRIKVKTALRQTSNENDSIGQSMQSVKDGMDIAFMIFNTETGHTQYAGANNPVYIIKSEKNRSPEEGEEIIQLKPDKMPIGIYVLEKESFTKNELMLCPGDVVYLFTDGYVDQFGGKNGSKFLSKRFKKTLLSKYKQPMIKQKQILDRTIEKWRGIFEQVDDITVMGIRI